MNELTENIKSHLNSFDLNRINAFQENNPEHSRKINTVDIHIKTSIEQFHYSKDIVLQAIDDGVFEKLPAKFQYDIAISFDNIINYTNNQNINPFIDSQQVLYSLILQTGLEFRLSKDFSHYQDILSKLSEASPLCNEFREFIEFLEKEEIANKANKIIENFEQSETYLKQTTELLNQTKANEQQTTELLNQTKANEQQTTELLNQTKANEQKVATAEIAITAFANNIENYKQDIDTKTTEADTIIEEFDKQREEIKKLIASAKKALQLKSTEGISTALIDQRDKSKSNWVTIPWVVGAFVFVIAAIGIALIGSGLITVSWIDNANAMSDSINGIIVRITIITIAISGAAFCAKQYTRQKNIAEDYAYKSVLAQSIVAFAKELEKYDKEKSVEFLAGAIKEINRSPTHKDKDEGITKNQIGLFENIIDMVKKGTKE